MKKLLIILTVLALLLVAFCSCGCNNDGVVDTGSQGTNQGGENGTDPDNCEHVLETIVGKDATCTDNGITDGVKCTKCGKITLSQQIIEAKGHDFSSIITIDSGCRGGEGYSAKICKRCGAIESDFDGEITHPHEFEHYIKEASCTSDGYEDAFKCKKCGKIVYGSYVEALGHDYEEYTPDGDMHYGICTRCDHKGYFKHRCYNYTVVKDPNCYEEGREVGVCEDCDKELEKVLPIKHEWNGGEVIEEATCTAYGKTLYTCLICGEEETKSIGMKPHDYGEFVVTEEPTCTESGKKVKTCQACEHEYEGAIDALGHLWNAGTVTREPDCYTVGNKHYECGRCDAEMDEALAKKHTFDSVEVVQEPTCTQIGKYVFKCSLCSAEISIEGSIKHDTTYTEEKEPTCTDDGNKEYWQCKKCEKYFSNVKTLPLTGEYEERIYSFNNFNCFYYRYTETTYDEIFLKATGHDFSNPHLFYDDEEHYILCVKGCGTKNAREEHIIETEYSLERSNYQDGKYVYYYVIKDACIICGYEKEEKLRKELLHEHDAFEILEGIDPTCTQNGLTSGLGCALCDVIEVEQEVIPALGHNFVNSICTRCGLNLMQGTPGLSYLLNSDGTAYIVTGMGTATTPFIVIGSEHKGLPVTGISEYAFAYEYNLISVIIPHTITTIGEKAFYECQKLVEVYNLSSITVAKDDTNGYVGNYALDIYTNILTQSKLVTTTKGYVFYTGQTKYLLGYVGSEAELAFPNMFMGREYSIYKYAFYRNGKITGITIGTKAKAIGNYAFSDCVALRSIDFRALSMDDLSNSNYVFSNAGKALGLKVTIGRNVTKIPAYLFCPYSISSYSPKITSVVFEDGSVCESIGYNAFSSCETLSSIDIPNSVTTIGNSAFEDCASLTSVTIPDSVTTIGSAAFAGCTSLTSITIGDSVTSIGYRAFEDCTSLTSITIPNSVTSLEDQAFANCTNLTEIKFNATAMSDLSSDINYHDEVFYNAGISNNGIKVTIGRNVTRIPACLFQTYYENQGLPKIISVEFEEGSVCESIGAHAFYNCHPLTSITIPNSITSIGYDAFYGCDSLVYNQYENGCYIGNKSNPYVVFMKAKDTSITSCVIHKDTKVIYQDAFSSCILLTSVTIGDSVTSIGNHAFDGCTNLTEIKFNATAMDDLSVSNYVFSNAGKDGNGIKVTIGKNVTKIPACLFYSHRTSSYSPKITSVVFEDGSVCESIGDNAFLRCETLSSIDIPNSVTTIGSQAFSSCTSLTSVTIGNGVTSIGRFAFNGCSSLKEVHISDIASWCNISFSDSTSNPLYYAKNLYINNETVADAVIPNTVTKINAYAFYNCTSLTSVTIGDSVTSIGEYAFYFCNSLVEINLNATAMDDLSLDNEVFSNAGQNGEGIKLTIGKNVTKIPAYLFYPYSSAIRSPKITSVEFEEGSICESIRSYAFYECSYITSITIPNSVTSIGEYAFSDCTALASINYRGTLEGWFKLGFGLNSKITLYFNGEKLSGDVVIPDGITEIPNYTFKNSNITSITIPNSITTIGERAFYNCQNLYEIYNLSSLTITKGSTSNGYIGYYAKKIISGETENNDGYIFQTINGVNYLVDYVGEGTELILPESYNGNNYEIYEYAFYHRDDITKVTIPNSVTSIGNYAFCNCSSLTSVTIGSSVTSIGSRAFCDCTYLTEIKFNATAMDDLSSGNYVFYNAGKDGNGIKVTIGKNVTKIPDYLFCPYSISSYSPKITSVVFEDGSVCESIGIYAFYNCTSLTSVTFGNTSGWYVTKTQGATSGTDVDVTNVENNATRLKNTYYQYYWYCAEN